ncbi:hypothetical protein KCP76_00080 [Salmonella enterica subsp. enterica serovar Weltevreden]|nr:hypothetical protein KCP76_00080 [Salmonella enterica subsp. enterica serovar Weltevreden]
MVSRWWRKRSGAAFALICGCEGGMRWSPENEQQRILWRAARMVVYAIVRQHPRSAADDGTVLRARDGWICSTGVRALLCRGGYRPGLSGGGEVGGIVSPTTRIVRRIYHYENMMMSNIIHAAHLHNVTAATPVRRSHLYPKLARRPMASLSCCKARAASEPYAASPESAG